MTEIDQRALRNAFGCFPTGVTIITTREADGTPRGFTANSFTSLSLDPPLLLISIAKSAASLPVFEAAGHFAVNILGDGQRAVSALFAGRSPEKFTQTEWRPGVNGAPLIGDALAWSECTRHQTVAAGDHVILIGRVVDFAAGDGNPLGFLRGAYVSHALELRAMEAAVGAEVFRVGAVIEADGAVLLVPDPVTGGLGLPISGGEAGNGSMKGLTAILGDLGVVAAINFLYALYEDEGGRVQTAYYRGIGTGETPRRGAFHALDALPWERIHDRASQTMLRRYEAEHAAGQFGVYVGDVEAGEVRGVFG
ncbi:MAG TPA: flavin reductase family protein [Hyphomicrobiaceae bacterium]|nr:flavin reductase family protein [Hyphomicrobiaceae bacterium]